MTVSLAGSGAVDDLKFVPTVGDDAGNSQFDLGGIAGRPLLPVGAV